MKLEKRNWMIFSEHFRELICRIRSLFLFLSPLLLVVLLPFEFSHLTWFFFLLLSFSGANNAYDMSNTFFFDRCLGWRGICVEPNPIFWSGKKRGGNRENIFFPIILHKVMNVHVFSLFF